MPEKTGYEQFNGIRKEIVDIVGQLGDVVDDIGNQSLRGTIEELRNRVTTDTFRVLIAGEFNAGKSTTVNALLGEKVLPSGGTPTTAVICVVRWGDQRSAVLYKTDKHRANGLDPTPVPIEVTELEKYVTVGASADGINIWGLSEVYWPLEFCRQGVEIIDSPGLNDSADHSRITLDYVNKADAVVFVFSALQALTAEERKVVDQQLKIFSHDSMFCLVNRINQVEDEDEVVKVVADLRARMNEYWGLGEDRVFFANSSGALRGRRLGQPALVEDSGLTAFEQSLERFLAADRGRAKIMPSAIQVREITAQARAYIDEVLALLDKDVAELTAEYERQRGPLDSLRKDRELIDRSIAHHLDGTRSMIEESARRMLKDAANSCPDWAASIDREHKVTLNPFRMREQSEAAMKEIVDGLSDQILQYAEDWQEGQLADLVTARLTDLEDQVGEKLVSFTRNLDQIRASLLSVGADDAQNVPSDLSRGAGAVVGTILNPTLGLYGAQFGFTAMLKALLPQLGVGIVLALVGFTPLALFGALFGMGAIQALLRADKLNKQLVGKVVEQVAAKLRDDAPDVAKAIADQAHAELDKQRVEIDRKLAASIDSVHEKVLFALQKRDEKQQSGAKLKQQLAADRQELADIDQRAAAVVEGFAMS
jgi:hypothetical protein